MEASSSSSSWRMLFTWLVIRLGFSSYITLLHLGWPIFWKEGTPLVLSGLGKDYFHFLIPSWVVILPDSFFFLKAWTSLGLLWVFIKGFPFLSLFWAQFLYSFSSLLFLFAPLLKGFPLNLGFFPSWLIFFIKGPSLGNHFSHGGCRGGVGLGFSKVPIL